MVAENQFYTLLLLINRLVLNYTKNQEPHFLKKNERILSHFIFYFEDNDHKPVEFNGETISFNCQLIKIKKLN